MADYDIRPLQLRILKILLAVDKVCKEHGLRYYIMAGTMLGAVRHKGFIPWDDDLDIGMPRADYDLLMSHSKEWLPKPYEAVCAENDPNYPLPFAKIQDADTTLIERMHLKYLGGIYLDVFPLDGVPQSNLKQRIHFARYEFYKRVLYFIYRDPYKHGKGPGSWLPLLCRRLFTTAGVQRSIRNVMTTYDFDKSSLVCDYDDGMRGIMPKAELGAPTPVSFEGETVWGVQDYDAYLTRKYGDYMVIPKQSGQRQHNFHYLNDDMYVLPFWDKVLYDEIEKLSDNYFFLSATSIQPHTQSASTILANYGDSIETFQEDKLLKEYMNYKINDWMGATIPPNIVHRDIWDLVGGYSIEYSPGMYSDPDFTAKLYMCGVRFMKGLQASRIYHFETKSTTRIRKNCGQMQFLLKWGMTSSTFRKVFTYKGKDFKSQKIGTFKTGNRFKISLIRGRLKAIFYLLTKDFGPLWKFWKKTFV